MIEDKEGFIEIITRGSEPSEEELHDLVQYMQDRNTEGEAWAQEHGLETMVKSVAAMAHATICGSENTTPMFQMAARMEGEEVASAFYTFLLTLTGFLLHEGMLK